ncbi:ectoine/hydroxyectoine ABC transporter permease subunit EhuC [Lichenihabitans sp. Uapishka_5]|uniref:ectoine/hydroxyectoine ABC transporter permease subunit EhuC n=1 Tax=Lichenihabitans sp. Uapishka_5 TaxID=3037302 RepID=UPI0029E7E3FE|nr:ectoine/hydroxyectoine ABC transporter permease subunit EhuC [Lichenihabitans sp. Uapishka_5]MDX7950332.1 ectoine/hydroxyectoine ABC transporter permease subunit EhuC [Lichenihabitans sp. Uapishka_5]
MTLPALLPLLLRGALVTLEVTALAAVLALGMGFAVGLLRLAPSRLLRGLATAYVEILRGTSALVQLFYLFYILPLFGLTLPPLATAVIGLGLNASAYASEVVRTTIGTVERRQWEAALALDMPPWLALHRIVLPQALPLMMPPFANQLVELLKATALVSLITLTDLTFAGSQLVTATGQKGLVWSLVLALYFVMAFPLSRLSRRLERRLGGFRGAVTQP